MVTNNYSDVVIFEEEHQECDVFGQQFQILGSSTIDSKTRFVEFSFGFAVFILFVNCVLPLLSVFGNAIVLATVFCYEQLRVPSNLMVASLATSDFLVGAIVQPSNIYNLALGLMKTNRCTVQARVILEIILGVNVTASLASICLLSVDRYIAITSPLRYHSIVTPRRSKCAICFSWVFGTLLAVSSFFSLPFTSAMKIIWWMFAMGACTLTFFVHCKILKISRRHLNRVGVEERNGNARFRKKDRTSAITFIIIFLTSLLCFLPYCILRIETFAAADQENPDSRLRRDVILQVAITLMLSSSSINPFVFFLRSKRLRNYSQKLGIAIYDYFYRKIGVEKKFGQKGNNISPCEIYVYVSSTKDRKTEDREGDDTKNTSSS